MNILQKTPEKRRSFRSDLPSTVKKVPSSQLSTQQSKWNLNKIQVGQSFNPVFDHKYSPNPISIQSPDMPSQNNYRIQEKRSSKRYDDPPTPSIISSQAQSNKESTFHLKKSFEIGKEPSIPKKCVFCQRGDQHLRNDLVKIDKESEDRKINQSITNPTTGQQQSGVAITVQEEDNESEPIEQLKSVNSIHQQEEIDDDNDYVAAAIINSELFINEEEIEGGEEDYIALPTFQICRCDRWSHSHGNCLLSQTLHNRYKCSNCATEASFTTTRVFKFKSFNSRFKHKKAEIMGILKVLAQLFVIFAAYSTYFVYQLQTKEKGDLSFIQVCSFISVFALFLNGIWFFINRIDILCIKIVSQNIQLSEIPNLNKFQLSKVIQDDKLSNLKSVETTPLHVGSPFQSEILSPKIPQTGSQAGFSTTHKLFQIQSQSQSQKQSPPVISSQVTEWQSQKQPIQIDPGCISRDSRTLFGAQIISRTPKRSVTLNEESPISNRFQVGVINQIRRTGSCLRNGSSSQSGSSGKSEGNQQHNSKSSSSSSPNEEVNQDHKYGDQIEDIQGGQFSRPFEGSGSKTCRFGASSSTLQMSVLGMSFAPTQDGLNHNNGIGTFGFSNHYNRWQQLNSAFKNGGAFFASKESLNHISLENYHNNRDHQQSTKGKGKIS